MINILFLTSVKCLGARCSEYDLSTLGSGLILHIFQRLDSPSLVEPWPVSHRDARLFSRRAIVADTQ